MIQNSETVELPLSFKHLYDVCSADPLLPGLKLLLAYSHDMVIVRDLDNHILFWNEQAAACFGWPLDEAVHQDITLLLQANIYPSRAIFEHTLFAQGHWQGEIVCTNRQGLPVFISSHQTLLCDSDGHTSAILSVDSITGAAHGQHVTLQNMNIGMLSINEHFVYTYVDRKAAQLLGKTSNELLGKHILDVFPELADTDVATIIRNAMQQKQKVHIAFPIGERWLDMEIDGYEYGLFFLLKDITHYKQMEQELRNKEKKLQRIIDANIIGFTLTDSTGNFLEANDAFLHLIGYSRREFEDRQLNITDITPTEYLPLLDKLLHQMNKTGGPLAFEKEYLHKNGQRVPVAITTVSVDQHHQEYFSMVTDLSAQKQLDTQKELFMSILGHELRTPLTAITGSVQLAHRRLNAFTASEGEHLSAVAQTKLTKLDKLLDQTFRQTRIQNRLINDLLDISRLAIDKLELRMVETDLISVVQETVEDMRYTTSKHSIEFVAPAATCIPVNIDADRIGQVVSNYISNAIKYSSPDQPIIVELTLDERMVRVWVHDRGPGLSPEMQARIWERYYRVPVQHNGKSGVNLGLGLYICQVLIQRHHGEVGVRSVPEEGSSFWFSLPRLTTSTQK